MKYLTNVTCIVYNQAEVAIFEINASRQYMHDFLQFFFSRILLDDLMKWHDLRRNLFLHYTPPYINITDDLLSKNITIEDVGYKASHFIRSFTSLSGDATPIFKQYLEQNLGKLYEID